MNHNVLKIYADKSYLPPGDEYVYLLYPFWGIWLESADDKDKGRFDEFAALGRKFFQLTPLLEQADVALLPFGWQPGNTVYLELAHRQSREAQKYGKKVLVFFNDDSCEPIELDNAIIFRTSSYRSKRRDNEFSLPGWSVDFLQQYNGGRLSIRKKRPVPTVGYCGYVDFIDWNFRSLKKYLLNLTGIRRTEIGPLLRGKAVRILHNDHRVRLNFVQRSGFSGGCDEATRQNYVTNIMESDYALVTRGTGNFSYRLYEVLSCGRIPVFINTDCALPYDHIIDWKNYCVWVESEGMDSLVDKIIEFHHRISEKEFEEMQRTVRRLYEEWLSPVGFHGNLWRFVRSD